MRKMAIIIHVDQNYSGTVVGAPGSATNPYPTIGDAVANAAGGDTVSVAAGNYNENVVIDKPLTLEGAGRASTIITGQGNTALGTIVVSPGVNGVAIQGFTIEGIDNASAGIESAAIYLQGAHTDIEIRDNEVVANGDAGLMGEFGAALSDILIDGNEFSGQTFSGIEPGGTGFANQFTENNVPRQLVVLGTNGSGSQASGITFTNNVVSGTAGGFNANGAQGNTLVTIDALNSTVEGNSFTGFTNRFATQLRVREENTDVENNTFSNEDGGNLGLFIDNDGVPGMVSGNAFVNDADGGPITGSIFDDVITGSDQSDWIVADGGRDAIDGADGVDTIDMSNAGSGGAIVDLANGGAMSFATGLDNISNIENVKGSVGNDTLKGNDGANTFIATDGNDTIDGRGGSDTYDASAVAGDMSVDLFGGSVSGAHTGTLADVENVKTGAGNDTIKASGADNAIDGGAGVDTVSIAADHEDAGIGYSDDCFTISTAGAGADTLVNVERVDLNGQEVWLVDSSAELSYALANAGEGAVIKLASGEYEGNFAIGTDGITLESVTGNPADVTLKGTFKSDNGIGDDETVGDWLSDPALASYSGAAGSGITVSGDDVTIRGITIAEYRNGVDLQSNSGLTIENVDLSENIHGIHKENGSAEVTGFELVGGTISGGYQGIVIAANHTAGQRTQGAFDGVTITGTAFNDLSHKGIYVEQLSNAVIDGITMNDVGQFGGSRPFGAFGMHGTGIDINLKFNSYENIEIKNFDFTDVGLSNGNGSPHLNGSAISVKARDDGSTYGSEPASLDGVNIHDGSIDGNSSGIRVGEPGKATSGPSNVVIENVDNNSSAVDAWSYDNQTTTPLNVTLGAGDDAATTKPTSTGAVNYEGLGGDDVYVIDGPEVIDEAPDGGVDTINSRGSHTLADNVENLTLLDAGTGTEDIEDFELGLITDGENGWNVDNAPRAEVIDLGGNKVVKISSNPSDGTFGGPYTPDIGVSAGEPQTTADGDVHVIKFKVRPVDAAGDNSRIEIDFAAANGTDRNNFMVIESMAGGVRIAVADPLLDGNWDTGNGLNDFSAFTGNRTLVSGVDGSGWLDIELRLKYSDGQDNDVIEVDLNGEFVGETTTFENYRDALGGTHEGNAELNQTSRVLVRASASTAPQGDPDKNKGFYFDDLSSTVTNDTNGTGNALDNVINGNSGNNVLVGLEGDDTLNGGVGNDTLNGGAGNDMLDGGSGNDIAVYSDDVDARTQVAYDAGTNSWTVTTSEGTDTLADVEIIDDATAGRVLLVGGDGFASIQAAVNAAQDGDTILIVAGVYDENVTVDRDITILGANFGKAGNSPTRGNETEITGGIRFVAGSAGATLDGVSVTGAGFKTAMGLDRDTGVVIAADGITIINSVLSGDLGQDTRPFSTTNGAQDFHIGGNLVAGWAQGGYVVLSTSGTIEGNIFNGNGNGVITESITVIITGNTFGNSAGAHVVPLPFGDVDVTDVVFDNNYLDRDRPITVYLNGTADEVTGSAVAETITAEYVSGPVTLSGGGGNDHLIGSAAGDSLNGGAGNDIIEGGNGIDRAIYSVEVDGQADIAYDAGDNSWTVTTSEGVDTLGDVEIIDDATATGGRVLLVGGDGFGSVQEAVDAAQDGDTILIAGRIVGDVNVNNKNITFAGVDTDGDGQTTDDSGIAGKVKVTGSKDVIFDGLEFRATSSTGTTGPSSAALDLLGSGSYTVRNSVFFNETAGGGAGARAIMLASGMVGTVLIENNLFTGASIGKYSTASWDRAIWSDGNAQGLTIRGNTFDNIRSALNLDGYDDATIVSGNIVLGAGTFVSIGLPSGNSLSGFSNNDLGGADTHFNLRNVETPLTLDYSGTGNHSTGPVVILGGRSGDTITASNGTDYIFADGYAPTEAGYGTNPAGDDVINALGGDDFVYGSRGNDRINGGTGNDMVDGGDGNDTLNGGTGEDEINAGAGDDTLNGGAGSDMIDGGAGTDTLVFDEAFADVTILKAAGNRYVVLHGDDTDIVTNVENFKFGGVTIAAASAVTTAGPSIVSIVDSSSGDAQLKVAEGTAVNTNVAIVTAADLNLGAGDVLTFSLVTASGAAYTGPFKIEKLSATTAAIRVNGALNYEAINAFDFRIKVTDLHGNQLTQNASIAIENVNEGGGVVALQTRSMERGLTQTALGLVVGTDPELDVLTYKLTALPSHGTLYLNGVAVAANAVLSKNQFQALTFSSPDVGPSSASAQFLVSDGQGNNETLTVTVNFTAAVNGSLTGTSGADRLDGGAGNDTINGGAGADIMIGGSGNDTIYVDNIGDRVIEQASGGTDTVRSSIAHALAANVENLILTGTANINAYGNAGANTLTGNVGNNVLNGLGGADTMHGGKGDDIYVVDNAGDVVVEGVGNGTDRVHTSVSHTLGANVEHLILTGVAAVSGTGNSLNNTIRGNDASNTLNGAAGNDSLAGNGGNDTLIGGLGRDWMAGGLNNDTFRFATTNETGTTVATRDVIADFVAGQDRVDLGLIDANTGMGGNQAFSFIGDAAFSAAGQLRAAVSGNATVISGDVNGDRVVDFQIALSGVHSLKAGDFIL
jgi:Ca2+-binding RTX toxin-like protein